MEAKPSVTFGECSRRSRPNAASPGNLVVVSRRATNPGLTQRIGFAKSSYDVPSFSKQEVNIKYSRKCTGFKRKRLTLPLVGGGRESLIKRSVSRAGFSLTHMVWGQAVEF